MGKTRSPSYPNLDADVVRADRKPFLGFSDNTNLLSWLWAHGIAGFYGGSTQVHLGPGQVVDPVRGLLAAVDAVAVAVGRVELGEAVRGGR